jgi:hypothetical protein
VSTIAPASRRAAVDVLVGLLAEIEETGESREFFDRVCEALCRLTSLERGCRAVRALTAVGRQGSLRN